MGFLLALSLVSAEGTTSWSNPVLYLAISGAILVVVTVLVVEFRQFEERYIKVHPQEAKYGDAVPFMSLE